MNSLLEDKVKFQKDLIDWYYKEARDLPWRKDPSPYRVWISEMMLQQTRVDTVIPYFMRFITEIPTVQELAKIEEDQLLKLWQGLGYYNRALNLKKAAQGMMENFNGEVPSAVSDLKSLPGIGPYSSGAIASIAFGKRVAAIDGNVLRIMARITASSEDIGNPGVKKNMEPFVTELLPDLRVGDFNQALMDLGATICLPNGAPKCRECPVSGQCKAFKEGLTSELPRKAGKKTRGIESRTVLVLTANGKYALRKRESGGLLPNLWEFPNFEGIMTRSQCENMLLQLGMKKKEITPLKPSKHIFSHLEWHMEGFYIQLEEQPVLTDYSWVTKEEIHHLYSIPTAFKAFVRVCID